MSITQIFRAVKVGEQLSDPAIWKHRQKLINALVIVMELVVTFFPEYINLSEEDIVGVATGIAILAGVFNTALINATSRKVGIGGKIQ